jgi:hypothetical protein
LRDRIGDPEQAEAFAAMSPEEYAAHKRVGIKNPTKGDSTRDDWHAPLREMRSSGFRGKKQATDHSAPESSARAVALSIT